MGVSEKRICWKGREYDGKEDNVMGRRRWRLDLL